MPSNAADLATTRVPDLVYYCLLWRQRAMNEGPSIFVLIGDIFRLTRLVALTILIRTVVWLGLLPRFTQWGYAAHVDRQSTAIMIMSHLDAMMPEVGRYFRGFRA